MSPPTEAEKDQGALRRTRWGVALVTSALVIAAVLAFGFAGRRGATVPPSDHLSIALSSTPHAALLHLAAARGYFAEEGLDVKIVPVGFGKVALDLLSQGKVDLAAAAEVPIVLSVLKGDSFDIAATVVSVSTEMAVVARRDRAISAPRDLVGKKIGATRGTSGEYFLWAFLIRHKLSPDAVTLVDVAPNDIAGKLARGEIDAAATWQPVRFGAESALGGNAVTFTEPDAYTVTHIIAGRREYLQGHRAAIERLLRAVLKAEAFNQAQPAAALSLVASRLKIDASALQSNWQDLDFAVDLRQSQLVTLEDEARWAMAMGYAPKRTVPNFLPNLYLDALLAVRPDRVTVVH